MLHWLWVMLREAQQMFVAKVDNSGLNARWVGPHDSNTYRVKRIIIPAGLFSLGRCVYGPQVLLRALPELSSHSLTRSWTPSVTHSGRCHCDG